MSSIRWLTEVKHIVVSVATWIWNCYASFPSANHLPLMRTASTPERGIIAVATASARTNCLSSPVSFQYPSLQEACFRPRNYPHTVPNTVLAPLHACSLFSACSEAGAKYRIAVLRAPHVPTPSPIRQNDVPREPCQSRTKQLHSQWRTGSASRAKLFPTGERTTRRPQEPVAACGKEKKNRQRADWPLGQQNRLGERSAGRGKR